MLFKNLEKCTEGCLKIELKAQELDILSQSLKNATLKGEHAIEFAKIVTKINNALKKAMEKENA